jgi:hypothetical protein
MVRWENGEIQFLAARKRKESEVMCRMQVLIKVLHLDCGCTMIKANVAVNEGSRVRLAANPREGHNAQRGCSRGRLRRLKVGSIVAMIICSIAINFA